MGRRELLKLYDTIFFYKIKFYFIIIIAYSENIGWKVVFRIFRSELQRILRRWGRSPPFFSIAAIMKGKGDNTEDCQEENVGRRANSATSDRSSSKLLRPDSRGNRSFVNQVVP